MGIYRSKELSGEFLELFDCVTPLCKKIRGVLFPLFEDRALHTGTLSDPPGNLYDPIAFDNAITNMAAVQESG